MSEDDEVIIFERDENGVVRYYPENDRELQRLQGGEISHESQPISPESHAILDAAISGGPEEYLKLWNRLAELEKDRDELYRLKEQIAADKKIVNELMKSQKDRETLEKIRKVLTGYTAGDEMDDLLEIYEILEMEIPV